MIFAKARKLVFIGLASLVLSTCGGSDKNDDENSDLADARAYKTDSPYTSVIARCVKASNAGDSCTLRTLPLIGMDYNDPMIPQIMDRVVVSHDWMGERFEEVLDTYPQEFLSLFKGVTAIVIDADIRPAYYTLGTGAIYLDPAYLWLGVDEKRDINTQEDYRAGFDDPLDFRQLNRYLNSDGERAYNNSGSLTDDFTRELDEIRLLMARLLLHELAHANDFIPPDSILSLSLNDTVAEAASAISDNWVSTRLSRETPLNSGTMFSLAGVMYLGDEPSIDDMEITASEVGDAFAPDGASDDYGYTTAFEDLAMLFEATMMKYFFDADYEVAFTSVPEDPSYCNFYQIGWGERNRLGHDSVKPRAQFAVEAIMPNLAFSDFFQNLDAATEISGDWCLENIDAEQAKSALYEVDSIDLLRPYL